jgi:hypothetical protein
MLKYLICFFIISCLIIPLFAQDSLLQERAGALTIMRQFRAKINPQAHQQKDFENLVNLTSRVIEITKTEGNLTIIRRITRYFKIADSTLRNSSVTRQDEIAKAIANDLELKLSDTTANYLSLEPYDPVFNSYCVHINASLNGKALTAGLYRLYWKHFVGDTSLGNVNWEGISDRLTSPYTVAIILPGYITFGLWNTNTRKLYMPDLYFYKMTKKDTLIDLNFTNYSPH